MSLRDPHPTDQEFFDALDREDDLGMVVRAHILIESMLLELVSLRLKRPEELGRRVGFEQRVRLALALGDLDSEQAPALRALNTLRNDFAHDVGTRLSKERVDAIWGALGQREQTIVQSIYRDYRSGAMQDTPFEQLEPRARFIAIVIVLRVAVLAKIRSAGGDDAVSG